MSLVPGVSVMKRWVALLPVLLPALLLAACATGHSSDDAHLRDLRDPGYLRTERMLSMTFPQIQMALFRHDRVCGNGPSFRMREGEASFAGIVEHGSDERPWNAQIVFDLTWLKPSLRYDTRTRVEVYSFYSDASVRRRIEAVFNAILNPDVCPDVPAST